MSRNSNTSFLVKQPCGYCFRIKVPQDLREVVDLHEIRYSLRTKDYLYAKARALNIGLKIRRLFSEIRQRSDTVSRLTPNDLKRLIKSFFLKERQKAVDDMLLCPDIAPWDLDSRKSSHKKNRQQYWDAYQHRRLSLASSQAQILINDNELDIPEDSIEFKRICHEILRAQSLVAAVSSDLEDGLHDTEEYHDPYFYSQYLAAPDTPSLSPASFPAPTPVDESPLLSEAIDRFLAERTHARQWKRYYRKEMVACLKTFQEFVGEDIHTWQIDSKLVVAFKEALKRLPSNRNKKRKYRDKSIHDIIKMPVSNPLSSNSVDKYLTRLGTFLGYAKNHGFVAENYATAQSYK